LLWYKHFIAKELGCYGFRAVEAKAIPFDQFDGLEEEVILVFTASSSMIVLCVSIITYIFDQLLTENGV
jgi:hypothetical protein